MSGSFDEIIDRRHTDCLKYDFAAQRGKPDDLLPLWVADMDFRSPDEVLEALETKCRHGIFGYSDTGPDYVEVLQNWFLNGFSWQIQAEWLVKTPGVVFAICAGIRALTAKGDSVLIQQPVYYPFAESVRLNERRLTVNQLVCHEGRYVIDLQDFEDKIIRQGVRLFILCSPHNPVGRVWTKAELTGMGDICLRHGVTVISDEIHADFVYPGFRHLVFANLRPEYQDMAITCTAPTKTFNLAGLQISNLFIANRKIRHLVQQEVARCGYSQPGIMGLTAARAAYAYGQRWLADLKSYLYGNLCFARDYLRDKIPQIKIIEPEGTFLVWLDCRELGLDDAALDELIIRKARLWLDAGPMFGAGGAGFQRINIACPMPVLARALRQLAEAVNPGSPDAGQAANPGSPVR